MIRVKDVDNAVNGRFSDGDPHIDSLDATRVAAYWLNSVQEELVNAVLASGQKLDVANEFQLLAAIRSLSGYDMVIDAAAFTGKSAEEVKSLNRAGFYSDIQALSSLREAQTAQVKSVGSAPISEPVTLSANYIKAIFEPRVLLTAASADINAFVVTGDGVEVIGARTKGISVPFKVDISSPQLGLGTCTLDRCIGVGAETLVQMGDGKQHVILEVNSTVF